MGVKGGERENYKVLNDGQTKQSQITKMSSRHQQPQQP